MKLHAALLCLLLSAPAFAASQVEALRASAGAVRSELMALKTSQLSKRNELSALSARIETLKASSKGRLLPGGELDAALKQSQELSGSLTALAQSVAAKESEAEAANLALIDALSQELGSLRLDFDRQTDRAVRRRLIASMRQLRSERNALRAAMPVARLPSLDGLKPSDDPEELLEQADLLRDQQEKLEKELKTLDARIQERRAEAELDRHVQHFMGEESMFDDQDRRLRLQQTRTLGLTTTTGGSNPMADSAFGQSTNATPATPSAGLGGAAPPDNRNPGGNVDGTQVKVTNGSDARPQVGGGKAIGSSDDDDTNDLDVERRKVNSLVLQLKQKAQELEKKAATLK